MFSSGVLFWYLGVIQRTSKPPYKYISFVIMYSKEVFEIAAHNYAIYDIAFSPDLRFCATASRDKTIKIWNLKSEGKANLENKIKECRMIKAITVNQITCQIHIVGNGTTADRQLGYRCR